MDEIIVVLGLGFGDEGKGRVVDWLCSKKEISYVSRYCGGPQAAHQVVLENGISHVFSSFGSGTLRGVPTLWFSDCPVNPIALENEYNDLINKGFGPNVCISALSSIITPYEIELNKQDHTLHAHGTCNAGIYATKMRRVKLYALDIINPSVLKIKMEMLKKYYSGTIKTNINTHINDFMESCKFIQLCPDITIGEHYNLVCENSVILEGSQGILLDQKYGFCPHVTPSNTDTKNISWCKPEVYLVTRAYQTRHGNGPMSPIIDHNIKTNPFERNTDDGPQGEFRRTLLDLDFIRYAANIDPYIASSNINLVITCMDLVENEYRLFDNCEIIDCKNEKQFVSRIASAANASNVFLSRNAFGEMEKVEDMS